MHNRRMMLNMDFSQRVVIRTAELDWQASPCAGVWRKPLAREEAERGHATSIVRYDGGASFHEHDHPLGEEILVLQGTFSDASGDYGVGTYFRNPEGFIHAPFSEQGCVILVKLHQFQQGDNLHICIESDGHEWGETQQILPLHEFQGESVCLIHWPAGAPDLRPHTAGEDRGGEEIYVISGELIDDDGHYPAGTWIRATVPGMNPHVEKESLIWLKTGHLA